MNEEEATLVQTGLGLRLVMFVLGTSTAGICECDVTQADGLLGCE